MAKIEGLQISEQTIIHWCPTQFRGNQGPKGPHGHHGNSGLLISEQTLPDVLGRTTEVLSGKDLFRAGDRTLPIIEN